MEQALVDLECVLHSREDIIMDRCPNEIIARLVQCTKRSSSCADLKRSSSCADLKRSSSCADLIGERTRPKNEPKSVILVGVGNSWIARTLPAVRSMLYRETV